MLNVNFSLAFMISFSNKGIVTLPVSIFRATSFHFVFSLNHPPFHFTDSLLPRLGHVDGLCVYEPFHHRISYVYVSANWYAYQSPIYDLSAPEPIASILATWTRSMFLLAW